MSRNIIVSGAAGNLGTAVVEKFKREGYHVIALVEPNKDEEVEEADDIYELDVTDEVAVLEFVREYNLQYGELDALAMIVGGFAMGDISETSQNDFDQQLKLNFFSAFNLVKEFLPTLKKQKKGTLLFVGARPALEAAGAVGKVAYSLSKKLIFDFVEILGEETKETSIRSHIFVPYIIDTPNNRKSMPDEDFTKWVTPQDIAEAMHFAVNTPSLQNTIFKLYGEV